MVKLKANIFTLYSNNKPIYVGKTEVLDNENQVNIKYLPAIANNKKLGRVVRKSKNVKIRVLSQTENLPKVWYNKKLIKHKEYLSKKYKLLNSDKVFGIYAYWQGKKKDEHTLKRLSESKFKPLLQFDKNGKYIRTWKSIKHAALQYKQYEIVNGSGESPLHYLMGSKTRFWKDCFWYKESEIIEMYGGKIPEKLHIKHMFKKPLKSLIKQYNTDGKILNVFPSYAEASRVSNISEHYVRQITNGKLKSKNGFKFKKFEVA